MHWGTRHGLLDGGLSRNRPLIGPSESLRGGTPGTHPRQKFTRQM
jgi:hypothetical protein